MVMQSRFTRSSIPQEGGQLLFTDFNTRTCYPDRDKLVAEIENDYGFQLRLEALDLALLTNDASRSVNILHGPLCIAGDARNVITTEQAVRRGMTLAVMELVTRHVRGEDTSATPRALIATDASEYVRKALHLNGRIAAATFRHVVTLSTVNALIETSLRMTPPDPTYPLGELARFQRRLSDARPEDRYALWRENATARVNVGTIIDDAICSVTQGGDEYLDCMPDVIAAFKKIGDASDGLLSKRFSMFINLFIKDSPPQEAIMEWWKTVRKNGGNSRARHFAKEDVDKNCRAFTRVMEMGIGSQRQKKGRFWLADGPGPIADADAFPSGLKMSPFAPELPAFPIKFDCVKTRLHKLPKGNTDANTAVRWEDLDDGVVKTKRTIVSYKRSTSKGQEAFTKTFNGFTYRLCYLEIAAVICSDEEEE
mmetsp:Transcript_18111/g.42804  ORF Transcript_18111/g.42804 Transcript_18111/m.42804 type:complete len:425 (+) Transcript_18111:279-1553(+)